jgi:hypothetical protein
MVRDNRSTDHIGKVFHAVSRDVRQCLVCEQIFTRQAASEHALVNCRRGLEDGGNTN